MYPTILEIARPGCSVSAPTDVSISNSQRDETRYQYHSASVLCWQFMCVISESIFELHTE